MNESAYNAYKDALQLLQAWLESCTRSSRVSRNTIAVGIVVLDHLRSASLLSQIVTRDEVVSPGGEIRGARSGLGAILEKYEIPARFLREVTTRQAHQDGQRLFDAFEWGSRYLSLDVEARDSIWKALLDHLKSLADDWFRRDNLKPDLDRRQAPTTWLQTIIEQARGRSGGIVEQHLVGAKLEKRFSELAIDNHPAHAADQQTARDGDYRIGNTVYHVTSAPGAAVVAKCARNLRDSLRPILLVPEREKTRARVFAEEANIERELTILAIEDFVSLNIIEMAIEDSKEPFIVLKELLETYNRRLQQVETDLSLRIEVR